MQLTVDEDLIEEARALLGTSSAQETIEVGLREVIRLRRVHSPESKRTVEHLTAPLRQRQQPPDEVEMARRRVAVEMARRARVKVGAGFNVAEELRRMRDANFTDPARWDETKS